MFYISKFYRSVNGVIMIYENNFVPDKSTFVIYSHHIIKKVVFVNVCVGGGIEYVGHL